MKPDTRHLLLGVALAMASLVTQADIYRIVDENGKVSYTDQPPENGNAENIQRRIDEAVERNTTHSLETQQANDPDWVKQAREKREEESRQQAAENSEKEQDYQARKKAWQAELKQAKAALKNAQAEQEKGREAIEGDFVGKAGGGGRPSEQYFERQRALEEQVKAAEQALKDVRKSRPKK